MLTIIKDWGVFLPVPVPEEFPVKEVGFWENDAGEDWYSSLAHNPEPGSITVIINPETLRVVRAHRDPSLLVPHRCRVVTVVDEGQDSEEFGGKLWNDGELSEPIDLVAYAADRRWQKEVGGIVVAGVPIATDDRSKLMITGARVAAMADPAWSTIWHGADGNTYPIDAATMVMISDEVQGHVNATFQTFAAVKAAIGASTITTTAEIDAAFA